MPAKTKNVLIGKQKRFIASRLMQISLLVDDYLYQQKPMSQKSAAAYIREISGYKDKCCNDVRSLQVIEKLYRCLNGIILEQQELNGECVEEDGWIFSFQDMLKDNNELLLSPVYSTADEDLTQLISLEINDNLLPTEQIQYKKTDSNKKNNDIETETRDVTTERVLQNSAIEEIGTDHNRMTGYFNFYPPAGNTEHPLNNDMEVIDLRDDDIDQIISQNVLNYEPELNIQNAISNLSIRDLEEVFTPFTQDYSQSILHSFHPTYTCDNANYVRDDVAAPLTNVKTTISHQKPATEIVTNNKVEKVLPATKKKLNVHAPVPKIPIANHSTIVMQNTPKDTQKTKAPKRNTKKRNDKNKINTKSSKTVATNVINADKIKIKQKQHCVKANAKPITNEVLNTTYAKEIQKKHSDYQLQSFNIKPSLTNSKTQPILKPNTDNKVKRKDTLPIYNCAVVNDLSWIENIRFVREIANEEYESFTDEGFWENCTLPNHWNEGDFNY